MGIESDKGGTNGWPQAKHGRCLLEGAQTGRVENAPPEIASRDLKGVELEIPTVDRRQPVC